MVRIILKGIRDHLVLINSESIAKEIIAVVRTGAGPHGANYEPSTPRAIDTSNYTGDCLLSVDGAPPNKHITRDNKLLHMSFRGAKQTARD